MQSVVLMPLLIFLHGESCNLFIVLTCVNCKWIELSFSFFVSLVLHWIETTVYFFSYNSFSSSTVSESICSLFLTTAFLSINQTHTFLQDVFSYLNYDICRRKKLIRKKRHMVDRRNYFLFSKKNETINNN